MTTYEEVWKSFLAKCKLDDLDLPTSDEAVYATIRSAISTFNVMIGDDLKGNDENESLDRQLDDDELLLLAHCIRLIMLENQLIYFSGTFNPFTKEIGTRNLANQMIRLEGLVEREEKKINSIVLKMADDFL